MLRIALKQTFFIIKYSSLWNKIPQHIQMIFAAYATFTSDLRRTITAHNVLSLQDSHTPILGPYESDVACSLNATFEVLSQPNQEGPAIFAPSRCQK